jgi:serine/threonine protein kinase
MANVSLTINSQFKPSDFENITLGKQLGAGSFGTVNVGLLPDGRFVAVKAIDIKEEDANADNSEIRTHSSLSHPNIVRYLYSKIDRTKNDPRLMVYLEFVTGGSVTSIMKSLPKQRVPYAAARVYARHMLEGLAYLHSRNIAHRDLKGDNLLISMDTGVAKLADFDQAKCFSTFVKKPGNGAAPSMMMGGPAATIAGTPFWMAPEVIENGDKGYDPFKADIWAMGCTVAEMLIGKAPWEPMSNMLGVLYKITQCKDWPDAIPKNDPEIITPELTDFFNKVFSKDPKKRPNVMECMEHPYIKGTK